MVGVGKDAYNSSLDGMIDQNILPWVEDIEEEGYPVWEDYEAVQRSTYFLDRQGELIYQFNITTLDPENPEDYSYFINLILDFRANNGPNVLRVSEDFIVIQNAIENATDRLVIFLSRFLVLVDNMGSFVVTLNFLTPIFPSSLCAFP